MIEFSDEFITMITDHFLIHWGLCGVLGLFDFLLQKCCRGKLWSYVKLNPARVPVGIKNIMALVLFNQFFVSVPLIYWGIPHFPVREFHWLDVVRLICAMFLIDPLFYYSHRLLHVGPFYKYIHKIHHRWTYLMPIATLYAHPIEHAITNVLTVVGSGYIAGLSYEGMRVWHAIALFNSILISHGGYRWCGYTNPHDIHHVYNDCNYGVMGIFDRLHQTNRIGHKKMY